MKRMMPENSVHPVGFGPLGLLVARAVFSHRPWRRALVLLQRRILFELGAFH